MDVATGTTRAMNEKLYRYAWGDNAKRVTMKGRVCRVLARGLKNSRLIEFVDNGQRECVSGNAIRKVK